MRKSLILLLCLFLAVSQSCNKSNSERQFIIENYTDVALNVVIYASLNDYLDGTGSIASGVANADGTFSFPASKLTTGSWYYVDAFSSDYIYTNWVLGDFFIIGQDSVTPRRFKYNGTDLDFNLSIVSSGSYARRSLLNGTQRQTKWKAIGALDLSDASDIWFSLTAEQRCAGFTVGKNDTGVYYYLSGGDTVHTQFTFGTLVGYPVYTIIPNEPGLLFHITNTLASPLSSGPEPPLFDTVTALINGYRYILIKGN